MTERCDVVILGAGVAGMTAAYRLRDRNIVVLEAEDRVGGRTLSGGSDRAWYNLGAQIVSSPRMIDFCRELGLDLVPVKDADFGFVVNGRLSRGSSPAALLARMNLPLAQRLDFGASSLLLRRKLHSIPKLDADARAALDRRSLQEVIGRVAPSTMQLLQVCCQDASGLRPDSISGLVGLAYAFSAYLDPSAKAGFYGIRGGSQQVTRAVTAHLDADVVRLGSFVRAVESDGESARVTYATADGDVSELRAGYCICSLPAPAVLRTVTGISDGKRAALLDLTPYAPLSVIAWPVADDRPAPWDGVFFIPVSGSPRFNLISNYGYLAKQRSPGVGGYLNTVAHGAPAARYRDIDDSELRALYYADLVKIFPEAADLLDPAGAMVQRWEWGLPATRPGYVATRKALREPIGRILFCGDYTSEPGLAGANNSGHYAAEAVLQEPQPSMA